MDRLPESEQMTVDEFLAFTDSRPDGEIWELIEGVAIMSPSPTQWHQTICKNILYFLEHTKRSTGAKWHPMPGVGTVVPNSPNSLPRPDVFVQESAPADSHTTDDAIVIFEVLSRSNGPKDRAWRKRLYGSVPNCEHYVTVATKTQEVIRHDRSDGWAGETIRGARASLELASIGLSIPLREFYIGTQIK